MCHRAEHLPKVALPTRFAQKKGVLLRALLGAAWHRPGPAVAEYQRAYERLFPASRAFAFWKGRVALHVVLKAMGLGAGDEVILPGYTCSMVPGAVIYTGARPVYVDIREDDYNLDPDLLDQACSAATKALIVQHTYGFAADMDRIMNWAEARGLPIIEDCCHALGCQYHGRSLGTFGVAAFFSSQWNKHYTSGIGGVLIVNQPALAERVEEVCNRELLSPGRRQAWMLAAQMLAHHLLVYPRTLLLAQGVFRWLTARGLVIGSASAAEFLTRRPEDYLMGMSDVQARVGLCELARLGRNLAHRRRMSRLYRGELGGPGGDGFDQPLVRYPLRVHEREKFLAEAARAWLEVGTWFECPLHPVETDHQAFGYRPGSCPVAERVARQMVNLPVHPRVSRRDAQRAVAFARKHGLIRPHGGAGDSSGDAVG